MNKLPKVFANPISKDINNEQRSYRSINNDDKGVSIYEIDNLLNSNRFVYRARVKINGMEKIIIRRVNDYVLTIDNEKIPIKDIKSFEII